MELNIQLYIVHVTVRQCTYKHITVHSLHLLLFSKNFFMDVEHLVAGIKLSAVLIEVGLELINDTWCCNEGLQHFKIL